MSKELSLPAQAVVNEWIASGRTGKSSMACFAACLRALVMQVQVPQYGECFICSSAELLAVVAELEAPR